MGYRLLQKQSKKRQASSPNRTDEHDGCNGKAGYDSAKDSPKRQDHTEVSGSSGLQTVMPKDDISGDEFDEEEASMLLSRFLTGRDSRPNSSGSPSGETRNDPVSSSPRKRPASAISKDGSEKSQAQPRSPSVNSKTHSENGTSRLPQPTAASNEEACEFQDGQTAWPQSAASPAKNQSPLPKSPVISNSHLNGKGMTQNQESLSGPNQIGNTTRTPRPRSPTKAGVEDGCSGDSSFRSSRETQHDNDQTKLFRPQRASNMDMKSRMGDTREGLTPSKSPPPLSPENRQVRRSARSRAGPTNYYAPPPGFHGNINDGVPSPVIPLEDEREQAQPVHQPQRRKGRLVYQSDNVRIIQESLSAIDIDFDGRIPYCDFEIQQNLAQFCASRGFREVESGDLLLHMDFTFAEINALCTLMECPCDGDDDGAVVPDLLAKLVRKHCPKPGDIKSLAKRIRLLCNLNEVLAPCSRELALLLIGLRSGDFSGCPSIGNRGSKKAWEYLCDTLDIKVARYGERRSRQLLAAVKEERLWQLADQCKQASPLGSRNRKDLRSFLCEAKNGLLPLSPAVLRAIPAKARDFDMSSVIYGTGSPAGLLRSRQLGYKVHRGAAPIKRTLIDDRQFELYKSWNGASNDVVVLSWSPDGTRFAAGAAAQSDEHHMQYNRNNNLLLGDLTRNKLKELPDHRIPRSQVRSNASTYATVDPNLYMSVSAMKWCGNRLYTASYDQTVKVWDVTRHSDAACIWTLRHPGKVQVMTVSDFDSQMMATGSEANSPFTLWSMPDSGYSQSSALELIGRKDLDMTPTSLSWGTTPGAKDLLVAGMSGRDPANGDPARSGHLALWQIAEAKAVPQNVSPHSLNVFDISWHPASSVFATASSVPHSARSKGVNRDTRSLVRLYDSSQSGRISRTVVQEYECPALDINDVSFCPFNPNYITASCTDGSTYVWDDRNPDKILHRLKHGSPIQELDSSLTREQADVGVRLALWGNSVTHFYTGSSDGQLKSWNILAATENANTATVSSLGQGIMSGAFSPDKNNILIGDACGGIHILSNAPWSRAEDDDTRMVFERAETDGDRVQDGVNEGSGGEEETPTIQQEANELFASGQLVLHPEFGAGKGPNYHQYYAAWARPAGTVDLANTPLNPDVQAQQLSGPPPHRRKGLDKSSCEHVELQIQLARSRNKRTSGPQEKRESLPGHRSHGHPRTAFRRPRQPDNIVDLTLDDDPKPGMNFIDLTQSDDDDDISDRKPPASPSYSTYSHDSSDDESRTSPSEWLEEDHWWPTNVDPNFDGEAI